MKESLSAAIPENEGFYADRGAPRNASYAVNPGISAHGFFAWILFASIGSILLLNTPQGDPPFSSSRPVVSVNEADGEGTVPDSAGELLAHIEQKFPSLLKILQRRAHFHAIIHDGNPGWRPTSWANGQDVAPAHCTGKATNPLDIFFPRHFSNVHEVAAPGIGLSIRPMNANPSIGHVVDGRLIYPDAWPETDVIYTAQGHQSEEFLHLRTPAAPTCFSYLVTPSAGTPAIIQVIRETSGELTVLNADGYALTIAKPYLVDAHGSHREDEVAWRVTPMPDGWRIDLDLRADGLTYPLLIDPTWSSTRWMRDSRMEHSVTALPDGRILVTGGTYNANGLRALATCEIYDPRTGQWSMTAPMRTGRSGHSATLLGSGKVLVSGGIEYPTYFRFASCEVFDPDTGLWSDYTSMNLVRYSHQMHRLMDGRILVIGGTATAFAGEIIDPSQPTPAWSAIQNISPIPDYHWGDSFLLGDGDVLATMYSFNASPVLYARYRPSTNTWSIPQSLPFPGHLTPLSSGLVLLVSTETTNCQLYDPLTSAWRAAAPLPAVRAITDLTVLVSGQVLACSPGANTLCDLYTPPTTPTGTGSWTVAPTTHLRTQATPILLTTGQVLRIGGDTTACEIFTPDPIAPSWTVSSNSLGASILWHSSTLLTSGKVLLAGGYLISSSPVVRSQCSLFSEAGASGSWSATDSLMTPRYDHTATLLPSGLVLVTGGYTDTGYAITSTCEIYNPALGTWSYASSMLTPRAQHSATLLPSGKVLVVGGGNDASCELYDPNENVWTFTAPLIVDGTNLSRQGHSATLMANGKVLIAGSSLTSCALYDSASETWSQTGTMRAPHAVEFNTIMLASGKVLCTDGSDGMPLTGELYDPATGLWEATTSYSGAMYAHSCTLLPNGQLLAAGRFGTNTPRSCLLYNETGDRWSEIPVYGYAYRRFNTTLLPSGRVLMSGGDQSSSGLMSEVFSWGTATGRNPPQLTSISLGDDQESLLCQGQGFLSGFEPSGALASSATPAFVWRSVDGERSHWLDSRGGFTATSASLILPPDTGPGWLRVVNNGLFSNALYVNVDRPGVTLSTSNVVLSDNGGTATITANLGRRFLTPVQVPLMFSGNAIENTDFTLASRVITIPAGMLSGATTLTGRRGQPGNRTVIIAAGTINGAHDRSTPLQITIESSNHAPTLQTLPVRNFPSLAGSSAGASQMSVAELINNKVQDQDFGDALGIAVIGTSGLGTWEYSLDIGANWQPLSSPSPQSALLLTDSGLSLLRYRPSPQTVETATLTYRAWDRTNGTAGTFFNLDTTGVGDPTAFSTMHDTSAVAVSAFGPPVVTLSPDAITWSEASGTPVQCDATAICIDLDSPTLGGGNIVMVSEPTYFGDRLDYDGTLTNGTVMRVGSQIMLDGATPLGTIAGGLDGQPLTIAFTAAVTPALAQTMLRGLTFTNISGNPAATAATPENRTLTVTVSDSQATSAPQQWQLTVVPVDSPPVITPLMLACVPGLTITGAIVATEPEGQTLVFSLIGGQTKGDVTLGANGSITYRNTVLDGQDDAFQIQATSSGQSVTGSVSIRMATPGRGTARFTSVPPLAWRDGVILSYTPTVTGVGNSRVFQLTPPLQIAATGGAVDPATYTFDSTTGTITIPSPALPSGGYLRCGLLVVDQFTHDCAYQSVLIKILAAGDG